MNKSTKKWLIVGGVGAAAVAAWYFLMGPGATPSAGGGTSTASGPSMTENEQWWFGTLTQNDQQRIMAYWPSISSTDRANLDWMIQNIWMVTPQPALPANYQSWFNGFTAATGIYKND